MIVTDKWTDETAFALGLYLALYINTREKR